MNPNYPPPRQQPYPQAYANSAYAGPAPGSPGGQAMPSPQVQVAPGPMPVPGPPQPLPQYQSRPRNLSTSSHASYHSQPAPGSPYGSPYAAQPQQYFPQPSPSQQLHPQEAYAENPFEQRRRRLSSSASAISHHSTSSRHSNRSARSHKSSHSHHSTHSRDEHHAKKKPAARPTLGDSLVGIWTTLSDMIPTSRK